MKKIILTIASFFMLSQIIASPGDEKDTMTILINSKNVAQFVIKGSEADIFVIKKMAAKNIKTISIQVKGPLMVAAGYTKTLETNENYPVSIVENKNHPGVFDITDAELKKKIIAGKKIPLKLTLNPSDPMMLKPSKIILLGTLVIK
jgi:hypothetical protein